MFRQTLLSAGVFAALNALPLTSTAQSLPESSDWTGRATVYGWLPVISGAQEGVDGTPLLDLHPDDILSRLDMAFMGTLEFQRGKWGVLTDVLYINLSHDAELLRDRLDISTETTVKMVTLAATYRWHEDTRSAADVYAGARYFDTHLDFGTSTSRGDRNAQADLSWTDGIIGIRGEVALNDRWSLRGLADIGGFDGSADTSWQIYGGANYAINESWQAVLGYRYMSIQKEAGNGAKLDIDIYGPVIGVAYKF